MSSIDEIWISHYVCTSIIWVNVHFRNATTRTTCTSIGLGQTVGRSDSPRAMIEKSASICLVRDYRKLGFSRGIYLIVDPDSYALFFWSYMHFCHTTICMFVCFLYRISVLIARINMITILQQLQWIISQCNIFALMATSTSDKKFNSGLERKLRGHSHE